MMTGVCMAVHNFLLNLVTRDDLVSFTRSFDVDPRLWSWMFSYVVGAFFVDVCIAVFWALMLMGVMLYTVFGGWKQPGAKAGSDAAEVPKDEPPTYELTAV